jgi:signal transduction histidine kinase
LELKVAGGPDLKMAIAPHNLAAVVGNLADNASKHSATVLSVEITQLGPEAHLSVKDNGSGVSPGNAPRLFDLFFTTRRDDGGTGMGLGIVKAMLQAHNGSIEYEKSAPGAAFRIVLPIATNPD